MVVNKGGNITMKIPTITMEPLTEEERYYVDIIVNLLMKLGAYPEYIRYSKRDGVLAVYYHLHGYIPIVINDNEVLILPFIYHTRL